MTDLLITMSASGVFTLLPHAGRIDEYCAKRLKIKLNVDFLTSAIKYYTLSFEPFSLSRKIVTENIYRDSENTEGIHYADGYIFCPIYDYMAVSPTVAVQIDGYETDDEGNVTAIIKSSIFNLEFAPSLTGEGMMLQTVRPDVKFFENVSNAVDKALETKMINGEQIENYSIPGRKIAIETISVVHLQNSAVTSTKIKNGAVTTECIAENSVTENKLANSSVTEEKLAENAVTADKISDGSVTSAKLANDSVTSLKLAERSVGEKTLRPRCVTTRILDNGAVTPEKLDREYITHHQSLEGYATENWVREQNYITENQSLDGYATEEWVKNQNYITEEQNMDGYATEEWVHEQNFLTEHQSLVGYATENWVESKGYITADDFPKYEDLPEKLSDLENDMAVTFIPQQLTDEQKETAIENIGAVKKEKGKKLSENDFTDEYKEKLDAALTEHQDISMKADISSLSEVAFSGSYNDLSDLPENCGFTDELKEKYNNAFTHSVSEHAPVTAQENIIESITVNGKSTEIKEKNVSLSIIGFEQKETLFMEVY